jgi:hypothetical protein
MYAFENEVIGEGSRLLRKARLLRVQADYDTRDALLGGVEKRVNDICKPLSLHCSPSHIWYAALPFPSYRKLCGSSTDITVTLFITAVPFVLDGATQLYSRTSRLNLRLSTFDSCFRCSKSGKIRWR